jgi:hypothetical protein
MANAGFVTASLKMDDLIASTGVNYRAVINPSFMDNLLRQVQAIKSQDAYHPESFRPAIGRILDFL